ncbi:membrane protein [Marmoricola endophyticus]|uniref:Membrane protein n=1 Tax=Marmoricola endophyticus TaxID=2040280 RepID=A0A917BTF7_9ACTN|nr:M50 family metallopeptidase [Marmoricola endophyticus]GGF55674.1 membrane protein [Marmoricola endophyticus]
MGEEGAALSRVWGDVTGTQPAPSTAAVWVVGVLALLVVAYRPTWAVTRHVVTIAHEGAHGVVALLSGRRLAGIRLHSDSSGVTVSKGRPRGIGMILTAAAGYVGPGLLGLAAAYVLHRGHALGLLWGVLLLLALLLLQIRNFRGLWSVALAGIVVFAVSWWAGGQLQSLVAYAGTWFLLLAAPKTVVELQRTRRHGRGATSDADQLARLTHLPGVVWVVVFLVVDMGALALGAGLILRPVG